MANYTPIEQIIAKIDNDFNLDNSDWIPRIATWVWEALSQLRVSKTVTKKRKLTVKNRIAKSACSLDDNIKVYDSNGCEIEEATSSNSCLCGEDAATPPSTGNQVGIGTGGFAGAGVSKHLSKGKTEYDAVSIHTNLLNPYGHRVVNQFYTGGQGGCDKNYVLVDCYTIELNYDEKYITVESQEPETIYSNVLQADVPVVPNNGLLIEAIAYYCMWKIMLRGIKHPVMNFAQNTATNPYYMWNKLKDEAKRSIRNEAVDQALDSLSNEVNSWFYNHTFPKR